MVRVLSVPVKINTLCSKGLGSRAIWNQKQSFHQSAWVLQHAASCWWWCSKQQAMNASPGPPLSTQSNMLTGDAPRVLALMGGRGCIRTCASRASGVATFLDRELADGLSMCKLFSLHRNQKDDFLNSHSESTRAGCPPLSATDKLSVTILLMLSRSLCKACNDPTNKNHLGNLLPFPSYTHFPSAKKWDGPLQNSEIHKVLLLHPSESKSTDKVWVPLNQNLQLKKLLSSQSSCVYTAISFPLSPHLLSEHIFQRINCIATLYGSSIISVRYH